MKIGLTEARIQVRFRKKIIKSGQFSKCGVAFPLLSPPYANFKTKKAHTNSSCFKSKSCVENPFRPLSTPLWQFGTMRRQLFKLTFLKYQKIRKEFNFGRAYIDGSRAGICRLKKFPTDNNEINQLVRTFISSIDWLVPNSFCLFSLLLFSRHIWLM